jgi:DNA-binding XRE family transcriptional regulator
MFSGQRKFSCIDELLSKKDTKDSAKGNKNGGEIEKRVLDGKLWRINKMKNVTDFEDLLKEKYGEKGTPLRDKYDAESLAFRLGIMLKEARKESHITQEELAARTGTKKSYISRIEKGQSDIQISTYYKLIELGLGKHLNISIG